MDRDVRFVLDELDCQVKTHPDKTAIVSYRAGSEAPVKLTYRQLGRLVDQLTIRLIELGVRKGDYVSYQLPNCWEFAVAHFATARLGAVSNPIMPIYRAREARFMIERTGSKVCIAPRNFLRFDYGAMLQQLQSEIDTFEHLVLFDFDGPDSLDNQLSAVKVDEGRLAELRAHPFDPDALEVLLFSSGTTGEPKGVLHSYGTSYASAVHTPRRTGVTSDDIVLMSSPLAHGTGFFFGVNLPVLFGCTAVYQDIWEPARAVQIIEQEGVTWSMGSAAFLSDICDNAEKNATGKLSLKKFACGGAPIPPQLVNRAKKIIGAQMFSLWGMTEVGVGTLSLPTDTDERITTSDGYPTADVKLRIVDDNGCVLPANKEGHLQIRTPCQHVAYLAQPKLYEESFQEGWFKTGDLGRLDDAGYLRIVGRAKDLVIRGGENVPIIEIENLLRDHPKVKDVAIVGQPDERLGERCHAIVVPADKGSTDLSLQDLTMFLRDLDVAKQYWPEFLSLTDQLPRNASGKVLRFELRQQALTKGMAE